MPVENHIRNPFELMLENLRDAGAAAGQAAWSLGRPRTAAHPPAVRRIGPADLLYALRQGVGDFAACRADAVFLCLIYPCAGLVLAGLAYGRDLLPMLFPLVSGFALLGPVAAVGLYEISRRREQGAPVSWVDALGVVRSPAFGSVALLSLVMIGLFALWMTAAYVIFQVTLGPQPSGSVGAFLRGVFETPAGWTMIAVGCGVGAVFAVVALAVSVVSFPLLLDRNPGVGAAIVTSLRAVAANPGTMAMWGVIVAGGLVLGSLPALVGLVVVMPVLGHATWHLYRRLVVED